jgi:hypothetical protein
MCEFENTLIIKYMKPNTMLRKMNDGMLMLLLLLLMACKREGPMGPEGPQGPDGEDAVGSGGGGNVKIYFTDDDAKIKWEGIDGWQGYEVVNLNINKYDWKNYMPMPDSSAAQIDAGALVLVYVKMDDEWHELPFKDQFNNAKGTYAVYVNYEIVNGKINILARVLEDVEVILDDVQKVKIVVAPASKTIPLTL